MLRQDSQALRERWEAGTAEATRSPNVLLVSNECRALESGKAQLGREFNTRPGASGLQRRRTKEKGKGRQREQPEEDLDASRGVAEEGQRVTGTKTVIGL